MHTKLAPTAIAALRAEGYYVAPVAGHGDHRYAWGNSRSGARQADTQQPPRRSQDQAWCDCQEYVDGEGAAPARPDWLDE